MDLVTTMGTTTVAPIIIMTIVMVVVSLIIHLNIASDLKLQALLMFMKILSLQQRLILWDLWLIHHTCRVTLKKNPRMLKKHPLSLHQVHQSLLYLLTRLRTMITTISASFPLVLINHLTVPLLLLLETIMTAEKGLIPMIIQPIEYEAWEIALYTLK